MKLCIPSYGPNLGSRPQPIFGRCEYFIFVDPDSMAAEVEPNPYAAVKDGAGVEAARLVVGKGAKAVLTSEVGTKARQALEGAGVEIIDINGHTTVTEVVEAFKTRQ